MNNKPKIEKTYTPLILDNKVKKELWDRLKGLGVKYLRSYKQDSYYRFIYEELPFKIVLLSSYNTSQQLPVFFERDGVWHINATKEFETIEEILQTVWYICFILDMYENDEEMDKMKAYAHKHNLNPLLLEHACIERKDGSHGIYFPPESNIKYVQMVEELARKYMKRIEMNNMKFGVSFQAMKYLSFCAFFRMIINDAIDKELIYKQINN
jgi:hypothetical protein